MLPVAERSFRAAAPGRRRCYLLFAEVFDDAPTGMSLTYIARTFFDLEPLLVELGDVTADLTILRRHHLQNSERVARKLAVEYTMLFEAQDRIYPNASCWAPGKKPHLLGEAARVAVDHYYEAGFTLAEGKMLRVDHIATELLFLSELAGLAARQPERSYERTRRFMEQAFNPWAPRFLAAVGKASGRSSYYSAWARLALRFIRIDSRLFKT
ncbi:MAG: molecular chaperone TorD family protein [Actinomycetia bacterium]|nr:molecular chaperone TorD family protein [Actinomycetes bacterium]